MKILFIGVTGLRNRGVDALVRASISGLKEKYPAANFTIMSWSPEYDSIFYSEKDVTFVKDVFSSTKFRFVANKIGKLVNNLRFINNQVSAGYREIETADLIIVTGGDVFSSDYGGFTSFAIPLNYAYKLNKRVVFLGHSFGRFKNEHIAEWKRIVEPAHHITVRESASHSYINNEIKIHNQHQTLTADVAFTLQISNPTLLQGKLFLDKNVGYICCSCSQGVNSFAKGSSAEHFDSWVKLIQHLLVATTNDILLIPHVQEIDTFNDDSILISRLMNKFVSEPRVKSMIGHYSSIDFKSVVAQAEFVIAERMHLSIAGLSSRVPTVVIGYSIKYEGTMFDCYPNCDITELCFTYNDFIKSPEKVINNISNAYMRRSELKLILEKSMPNQIDKAKLNFTSWN